MSRSRILIVSLLALVVLVTSVLWWSRSPQSIPANPSELEQIDDLVTSLQDGGGTPTDSSRDDGDAPDQNKVVGLSSPSMSAQKPEVQTAKNPDEASRKNAAPCQKAEFKTSSKDLKGHLHEIHLQRSLAKNDALCVFVDGKSVLHTRLKDGRVRIDSKLSGNKVKVSALYCSEGVKCQVACPEPEKDFWDSIGAGTGMAAAGSGFADSETQDEKELQKELKALKDVLNRKPAEAPVATWTTASLEDSSCQ